MPTGARRKGSRTERDERVFSGLPLRPTRDPRRVYNCCEAARLTERSEKGDPTTSKLASDLVSEAPGALGRYHAWSKSWCSERGGRSHGRLRLGGGTRGRDVDMAHGGRPRRATGPSTATASERRRRPGRRRGSWTEGHGGAVLWRSWMASASQRLVQKSVAYERGTQSALTSFGALTPCARRCSHTARLSTFMSHTVHSFSFP